MRFLIGQNPIGTKLSHAPLSRKVAPFPPKHWEKHWVFQLWTAQELNSPQESFEHQAQMLILVGRIGP